MAAIAAIAKCLKKIIQGYGNIYQTLILKKNKALLKVFAV